jgi:SAM-dependent methyltransferase
MQIAKMAWQCFITGMSAADLTVLPQTDPLELYRLRDGFYATDLVGAALVYLDFFSWLAERPSDLPTICGELKLVARPVDVMLTLFTALGLVEARQEVFHVTPLAREHLVRSSPWYLGPYYAALKERPVCKDFLAVLQTGRTAKWGSFDHEKDWARAMEDEAFARQFTAAMDCRGVYLAPAAARALELERRKQLLDVAGGSGIYACALVAQHPHLRATVLEKPPVDQVARRAIAIRGFAERVEVRAGDMLADAFPAGFDVHLLSNVLHDWDEPVVRQLLEKSFQALAPGGLLVVHDAHINESKTGPLPVAKYSALLMHSTEGKCYSLREMREYLTAAGFIGMHFQETAVDRSVVTATKP